MIQEFVAAVVGSPFGIKGYVKLHVPSGETEHLEELTEACLRQNGKDKTYQIEGASGAPSSFVMKFKGIDSPEAAKILTGSQLIVPRSGAAPLYDDEYYVEDLRGISVQLADGEKLGELCDILEGGGGQLAEIQLIGGSRHLVPFRDEFFPTIDLEKRIAILRERWMIE
ncbi:ribosome maturation factor RimM [Treponema sp.]